MIEPKFINYPNEGLYIAGPDCFYPNGFSLWWSKKLLAEYYGIPVVVPTEIQSGTEKKEKREKAKIILSVISERMEKATCAIASLSFLRPEVFDSGTIFELGWLWQKGCPLYSYNFLDFYSPRTKISEKDNNDGESIIPSTIYASTKLINGDFEDALKFLLVDLEEKEKGNKIGSVFGFDNIIQDKDQVYIALSSRYQNKDKDHIERIRLKYKNEGLKAVFPNENEHLDIQDVKKRKVQQFKDNMQLLLSSTYFVADLNDYKGWEVNSDVAFECGVAYGRGLKCIGYTKDNTPLINRIPELKRFDVLRDSHGNEIEDFDLHLNLMFAGFDIIKGCPGKALLEIVKCRN